MVKSLSDTLGGWFVKYGIWVLLAVTLLGLFIAGIISWTSGSSPEKKSFSETLKDAEEFLLDTVLGPEPKAEQKSAGSRGGKYESKGEAECRRILRELFDKPAGFGNARPDFLNNSVTGGSHNLEIDCWEPSLKLGVEYNGRQHYEYTPYFHKNREAFMNQKYRDELKRRMCRDNGVNLIEVPHTVKHREIEPFLRQRLRILGYI